MRREAPGESAATDWSGWDYTSSRNNGVSTTTVSDKRMVNVIGKPYRGEPDVRFDEGSKGMRLWFGLRHRCFFFTKVSGNSYSPIPVVSYTEVLLY